LESIGFIIILTQAAETLSIGKRVSKAILSEASSIKAGNVHPQASFSDMQFEHFQRASSAIGQAFDRTVPTGQLGQVVLVGVQAMLEAVGINTSLGTILLLAPMALSLPSNDELFGQKVSSIIHQSTASDSQKIYQAIRLTNPGGLGKVDHQDVRNASPPSILEAMELAASWDDVALQYTNGFEQVSQWTRRLIGLQDDYSQSDAIRCLQIEILASRPDSLIVRKHGKETGSLVQSHAFKVLQQFDHFLRHDQHRMNPGTTADLIAAVVFLASYAQEPMDG
jgi:triphosphoribosyl-dephospho-CoA synthase